jgi:RNA polymerase sigma-70 factor (ECF subfamily)
VLPPRSGDLNAQDAEPRQPADPAAARLLPLVYDELRALAAGIFRSEAPDHTLQPTALVHEAWLRLSRSQRLEVRGRAEFHALAAGVMRHVLADHARRRRAEKRGGGRHRTTLVEVPDAAHGERIDLVELNDVLEQLAAVDPRQLRIVEMRFFGGLEVEEVADALSLSKTTVEREWRAARAWLSARWKERERT